LTKRPPKGIASRVDRGASVPYSADLLIQLGECPAGKKNPGIASEDEAPHIRSVGALLDFLSRSALGQGTDPNNIVLSNGRVLDPEWESHRGNFDGHTQGKDLS
jgi:hypothetical protein